MQPSPAPINTSPSPPTEGVTGLTGEQVHRLRETYGFNEVTPQKRHPVLEFLRRFTGVSAWMLELILIISLILGKYPDVVVVGTLLVVNAVVGFYQERRATGIVEALRRRLQVSARVLRDSNWQVIPARELVPGDRVRVRAGDLVPADLRLVSGELRVDQSAVTGESAEVAKSAGEPLFSGSVVRRGEGDGLVESTGSKTFFGRTTELVKLARPVLHIEEVVARLVRWLFAILGTLLALVFAVSLFRGMAVSEILPLMLVLLMSAVPVALPVMFTVSMAVGSRELARLGVLVTRLSAAEDAATMDTLCVDKTGTITMNRLGVAAVMPVGASSEAEVLAAGALASSEANNDPIDMAFLEAARERRSFDGRPQAAVLEFVPFDAERRRTEAVVDESGVRSRVMKGAIGTIAELCNEDEATRAALDGMAAEAAKQGYRALAVAKGAESGACKIIGVVTLSDPPRPEAARLIETLNRLGVRVRMLTGDALPVAVETARLVGLTGIRRAADLPRAEAAAGEELLAATGGFAEVYPEDKYRVVQYLQQAGHVTGMTGDGVNDAPALRQAEVGIAVSSATDVAKGAASVVLTEPGLTNIVALVEQGRIIYQRLLTWVLNKISRTVLKAAFVSVAFLMTGKFVVSAFAMLLLTFMNDFAKIALATDRVRPSEKPETWNIGRYVVVAVALGVAMVVEALLLLVLCREPFGLSEIDGSLYTFSFLTLLYLAIFSIFSVRERMRFNASMPGRALLLALAADAAIGTFLTFAGLPGLKALPWWQIVTIFGYAAFCCLVVNDLLKIVMLRFVVSRGLSRAKAEK